MSRPRKNTDVKVIQGTFRQDRELEPDFYQSLDFMPDPPPELGKAGRELWVNIGAQLTAKGVLASVDLPAFQLLCDTEDFISMFKSALTCDGKKEFTQGVRDDPLLFRSYRFWLDSQRKMMLEFGLTPASRNRVSPNKKKEESSNDKRMKELVFGDFAKK